MAPVEIVGVITARGGSKGIPGKNLLRFEGLSLVARSVLCARSACLSRIILTTDDAEIAEEGRRFGAEIPGLRPAALATDTSPTMDAVRHAIKAAEIEPDIVVLIQPTAPLRYAEDIGACLSLLDDQRADGAVSVCRLFEPHPMKAKRIEDGWLVPFIPNASSEIPRQELVEACRLNGAVYAVRWTAFLAENTLLPERTAPYFMPPERSINLDSPLDVALLEIVLEKGVADLETYADLVSSKGKPG